jgi:hypothetical protein
LQDASVWVNSANYVNPQIRLRDYQTGMTLVNNDEVHIVTNATATAGFKLSAGIPKMTLDSSAWLQWSTAATNGFTHDVILKREAASTLAITGSVKVSNGVTGSLLGTASWAVSASWAPSSPAVATISSYIATGSITASVNADPTASFKVTSGSRTLLTLTNDAKVVIGTPGEFIDYQLEVSGAIKADYLYCNSNGSIASSLYGIGQLLTGGAEQPVVYLESTWNTTAAARGIEYRVTNTDF